MRAALLAWQCRRGILYADCMCMRVPDAFGLAAQKDAAGARRAPQPPGVRSPRDELANRWSDNGAFEQTSPLVSLPLPSALSLLLPCME